MNSAVDVDSLTDTDDVDQPFEQEHPLAAAILVILIGVSGCTVNLYILYRIIFKKVFGRLFGWMWICRGICLVFNTLMDVIVYGPSLVLYPDFYNTAAGRVVGLVQVIGSMQGLLANLLIASNRCLLIRKPLKFKSVFTPKKTAIMIALAWILPIVVVLSIRLMPFQFDVEVDDEVLPMYYIIQVILCVLFAYLILIITLVIDLYAVWKLRKMNQIRSEFLCNHLSPSSKRKHLNLCYMILLQSLVEVPTSFIQIVYYSVFWNFTLTLDGLIVIYFNDDLRPWRSVKRERDSQGRIHRVSTSGTICSTVIE